MVIMRRVSQLIVFCCCVQLLAFNYCFCHQDHRWPNISNCTLCENKERHRSFESFCSLHCPLANTTDHLDVTADRGLLKITQGNRTDHKMNGDLKRETRSARNAKRRKARGRRDSNGPDNGAGGQLEVAQQNYGSQSEVAQQNSGGQLEVAQQNYGGQPEVAQQNYGTGNQLEVAQQNYGNQPEVAQQNYGNQPEVAQQNYGSQLEVAQQNYASDQNAQQDLTNPDYAGGEPDYPFDPMGNAFLEDRVAQPLGNAFLQDRVAQPMGNAFLQDRVAQPPVESGNLQSRRQLRVVNTEPDDSLAQQPMENAFLEDRVAQPIGNAFLEDRVAQPPVMYGDPNDCVPPEYGGSPDCVEDPTGNAFLEDRVAQPPMENAFLEDRVAQPIGNAFLEDRVAQPPPVENAFLEDRVAQPPPKVQSDRSKYNKLAPEFKNPSDSQPKVQSDRSRYNKISPEFKNQPVGRSADRSRYNKLSPEFKNQPALRSSDRSRYNKIASEFKNPSNDQPMQPSGRSRYNKLSPEFKSQPVRRSSDRSQYNKMAQPFKYPPNDRSRHNKLASAFKYDQNEQDGDRTFNQDDDNDNKLTHMLRQMQTFFHPEPLSEQEATWQKQSADVSAQQAYDQMDQGPMVDANYDANANNFRSNVDMNYYDPNNPYPNPNPRAAYGPSASQILAITGLVLFMLGALLSAIFWFVSRAKGTERKPLKKKRRASLAADGGDLETSVKFSL